MCTVIHLDAFPEDLCAVSSETVDAVELAINGDEAALSALHTSTLDQALRALDACKSLHCENHAGEYAARGLLDRVYFAALDEAQEKLDTNCDRCHGANCSACV